MRAARAVGLFFADLLVGDDWRMSVGMVASLALCAVLAHAGVAAWWPPPLGAVLVLAYSLHRESRPRAGAPEKGG